MFSSSLLERKRVLRQAAWRESCSAQQQVGRSRWPWTSFAGEQVGKFLLDSDWCWLAVAFIQQYYWMLKLAIQIVYCLFSIVVDQSFNSTTECWSMLFYCLSVCTNLPNFWSGTMTSRYAETDAKLEVVLKTWICWKLLFFVFQNCEKFC